MSDRIATLKHYDEHGFFTHQEQVELIGSGIYETREITNRRGKRKTVRGDLIEHDVLHHDGSVSTHPIHNLFI